MALSDTTDRTGLADLHGERYYAEQDAFVRYLQDHVNPARKAAGLELIETATVGRTLFRLTIEWDRRLRGLPHMLDS